MKSPAPFSRHQSFIPLALACIYALGMGLSAMAQTVVVESKLVDGADNPAFEISPALKSDTAYSLEVTFGTSNTQGQSPDLLVTVQAEGVKDSSLPATTTAFQASNANTWTSVGKFTAASDTPTFTFTYASGSLGTNPPARWHADAVRFVPSAAKAEAKAAE